VIGDAKDQETYRLLRLRCPGFNRFGLLLGMQEKNHGEKPEGFKYLVPYARSFRDGETRVTIRSRIELAVEIFS